MTQRWWNLLDWRRKPPQTAPQTPASASESMVSRLEAIERAVTVISAELNRRAVATPEAPAPDAVSGRLSEQEAVITGLKSRVRELGEHAIQHQFLAEQNVGEMRKLRKMVHDAQIVVMRCDTSFSSSWCDIQARLIRVEERLQAPMPQAPIGPAPKRRAKSQKGRKKKTK